MAGLKVIAGVVGKDQRDVLFPGDPNGLLSGEEWMVDVENIHRLCQSPCLTGVAQAQMIAGVQKGYCGRADDARLGIQVVLVAKGEDVDLVPPRFENSLVERDKVDDPVDGRLVRIDELSSRWIARTELSANPSSVVKVTNSFPSYRDTPPSVPNHIVPSRL